MDVTSKTIDVGGKNITLEIGRFAQQATAAVSARVGETIILSTVVAAKEIEGLDYFPLTVEYVERLYAGGKIKGSKWVKREGRPSDEAVLIARLIDRSIRPLFPKDYKNEVQVIITVLSVDAENSPDIPAIIATSAALAISEIPWSGPVGAVRLGFVPKNGEGAFVVNPTHQDLEFSEMDLIVSGVKEGIIMLEGGARIVSEETILKALEQAQAVINQMVTTINELQKEIGVSKQIIKTLPVDSRLVKDIEKEAGRQIAEKVKAVATKSEARIGMEEIIDALAEKYDGQKRVNIGKIVTDLVKKTIRESVLKEGKRIDGRKPDQIRPIEIEVGLLPRTHGSAMFKRGNTQALTVTTLGSPSLEQLIESMEGEETKRYMHHYYMPPFSVGEAGRLGWPSRREIGHGDLAERALLPVIPSEEKFPYTIRVVSEILSSNGSTSMASVCGSTLSLMDAGVPIKAPVAGIAMGMVSEQGKKVILSDIMGVEDFNGDMDFKIAGTREGIIAMQMDVKDVRLKQEDFTKILTQAKEGRLFILEKMMAVLPISRAQISKFAPKIKVIRVPVEKIGEVIGGGGKTIRQIIADTGANIEVEDDGAINISSPDEEAVNKAVAWIEGLVKEVKPGEIYEGTVKRIQPFGVFVEILPGKEGLVHVSRMAINYVADPNTVVKVGQKVKVQVEEIDERGRINLTMVIGGKKPLPRRIGERREFRPYRRPGPRRPDWGRRYEKRY